MKKDLTATAFGLESLETRKLLAPLVVNGTNNADVLRVAISGSNIVVTVNGNAQSYSDAAYDSIVINGAGGADLIDIDSNGTNPTTIDGGAAADLITLGGTDHNADGVTAPVTVTSSDGLDSLFLDDSSNDSSDEYDLAASGLLTRGGGFGGVTATGLAKVSVDSGSNIDVFVVNGTPSTGTYRLMGGADIDQFRVLATGGATLILDGGADADELILNQDGGVGATVTFDSDQDFSGMDLFTGGIVHFTGSAGLYLSGNQSSLDGDITLDRGFIIEHNSQSQGGLQYYRDRLRNGPGAPVAGVPRLTSPFAAGSSLTDAIGYGYAQDIAPTSVDGFNLVSGDLLLRYTLKGDADLNQSVDFNDLLALARNYNGTNKGWAQGDFDLDADVDFDDLLALAKSYGQNIVVATTAATTTPTRGRSSSIAASVLA